jgi:ATP-dependent Lon protease
VAVEVAEGKTEKTVVGPDELSKFLGPKKFESEIAERMEIPGVALGLAWTSVGGDILFIEVGKMSGKGNLKLTGQLGDVMKESATAAVSYLRTHSDELRIPQEFWEKNDLHVHLPAGAIPKDGPSAGIALVTAIASLATGIKVRSQFAMTGEITLRGNVLPIGGVKEKVLGALRAGVKEVILPERNKKDLIDVPDSVKSQMKFHFVTRINEVLDLALENVIERAGSVGFEAAAVVPPPTETAH